jgi:hypothetical protein
MANGISFKAMHNSHKLTSFFQSEDEEEEEAD